MQNAGIFTTLVFWGLNNTTKAITWTFDEYFYPKYSKNLIRTLRFKLQDSPDRIELLMLAINHPLRGIIMLSIVEEFYLVYLGIKRILDIPSNIVTI